MKLIELFNHLTQGEFSQLNIGGASTGEIKESNYEAVISHINLALSSLYVRFPLKFRTLTLDLQAGQVEYYLTTAFAVTNTKSKEAVKYILDTASNKFTDDILKIETIKTDADYEVKVNDPAYLYSLFTPTPTTLVVPELMATPSADSPDWAWTDTLSIYYRAAHPFIATTLAGFDPETYEVELPRQYVQALLYNVASRANNPFGASQNYHAGDSYFAKYEAECLRLEQFIRPIEQNESYDRIRQNGWV